MSGEVWRDSALSPRRATPHAGPWLDARDLFSFIALAATFIAVLGLFTISPFALEKVGFSYIDEGGGLFTKFHPATPVAFIALGMRCLASRRPVHTAWRLLTGDAGIVLMLASVIIAGIFALGVDKTPVTPLVDTFCLPVLIFLLLRDLDHRAASVLALLVALVLTANACIAIVELLRGFHLIEVTVPQDVSADPTKANAVFSWKADAAQDWRPQALLGHPLVNGLVVGSLVICLAAPGSAWIPRAPRFALLGLQTVALASFGARTALVLTAILTATIVALQVFEAMRRGARLRPRATAFLLLAAGAALIAAGLLAYSGLLDRTLDRFGNDYGSASTRVTMFTLLGSMSPADLFLRPDKDLVATLQRLYGLEFGIESSWIGLALTYGLVVAGLITIGLLTFWRSVVRVAGRGAFAVCVLSLVQVSVTASLSGKTTTFAIVVALIILFLRPDASSLSATRRVHRE